MDRWRWLAPLSGIVFVVLLIVGFAVAGEPPDLEDDGVQEVIDFYVDNKDQQYMHAVLVSLAGFFLLVYGAYLRKVLHDAEGPAGFLSIVPLAGLIILMTGAAIDATIGIALAEHADDVEPSAIEALAALWQNDFVPFSMGMLTFLLAMGISIVRHGALPKWMGWIAIVISFTAASPAFPVAAIGALLLIIISGVIFARRERAAMGPATPGAAPPA